MDSTSIDKPTILLALEMICLDRERTDQDKAALGVLRQAIENGDNPNWWYRDRGGSYNALGALGSLSRNNLLIGKFATIIEASRLLIEAGAHPFDRFEDVFGSRTGVFGVKIMQIYAEKEMDGPSTLDSKGQTLLHYPAIWGAIKKTASMNSLPMGWMNAQRKEDLMTPLHVMWQHTLKDAQDRHMNHNYIKVVILPDLMEKTALMAKSGARFDLQDHHGVSVASYIAAQIKFYDLDVNQNDVVKSAWSFVEAQIVRDGTSAVPTVPRSPRL